MICANKLSKSYFRELSSIRKGQLDKVYYVQLLKDFSIQVTRVKNKNNNEKISTVAYRSLDIIT